MRLLSVLVPLLLLAACSDDPEPRGPEAYDQVPRPVRDGESAVRAPITNSGEIEFKALGLTANQERIAGSHAEVESKNGQYVRIRILLINAGRTNADVPLGKQQLVVTDGKVFAPDEPTMILKRQPLLPSVGAAVRLEFDLWYDIPKGLVPKALRVVGSTPYTTSDPPAIDIPLSS